MGLATPVALCAAGRRLSHSIGTCKYPEAGLRIMLRFRFKLNVNLQSFCSASKESSVSGDVMAFVTLASDSDWKR